MADRPLSLHFVAGEPSGDLHASGVIAAIRRMAPGARTCGIGGPRMAAAGMDLREDLASDAIMGIFPVLKALPRIRRVFRAAVDALRRERPDALVLVDYPGFNVRLAAQAKRLGIPVIYYISPQVWAWGAGRVEKLARLVDLMLVILPFEEPIFTRAGIRTTFVGHPVLEHVAGTKEDAAFVSALRSRGGDGPLVGVFPGSRRHVVASLLRDFVAAGSVLRGLPGAGAARLVVALAQPSFRDLVPPSPGVPLEVVDGRAIDVMRAADVCLTTSGSTTLEIAAVGRPFVLAYRPSLPLYWIGRRILRVPHIGLVNLVAGEGIVPEHVSWRGQSRAIAKDLHRLVADPQARRAQLDGLAEVRARLMTEGAYEKAAAKIVAFASARTPAPAAG